MASRALREWRTVQRAELDRLAAAIPRHEGRSAADAALRQQLVDAGIVLLAAHFQRYCRELHAEAARALARHVRPRAADKVVEALLVEGARLGRGNAHPDAITSDFGRLGLDVWKRMEERSRVTPMLRSDLITLNTWRNAIAHQTLPLAGPGAAVARTARTVAFLRRWRATCGTLADDLDRVVSQYLTDLVGAQPW